MIWPVCRLQDICEFQNGFAFKSKLFSNDGTPILRISNIQSGSIDLKQMVYTNLSSYKENLDKYRVVDGDLLIAMSGATTGKIGINQTGLEFLLNQRVGKFLPSKHLDKKYLYYYLNTKIQEHLDISAGSAQPNLSTEQIKSIKIPLPDIPEQKRIVTILEQAFADIEQARAKTEQNLKNAQELFESYLHQIFSHPDGDWVATTLGKITGGVFTGPFGSLLHKSDYIENGIPLVNPAHITSNGIETDPRKTISNETAQRLSNYIMRQGDVVIARRGEMGRCALISKHEDGFLCGTGSFVIKSSEGFYGQYLVRYLRSFSCKAKLEKIAGGAVMPNLSNKDLSNLKIIIPPLEKQISISNSIDKLAIDIEKVISIYQNKINNLEELKKSILQKAFAGEMSKNIA
ncbi:MAG: type I restriction enzyme S subunit [Arenicella sp.]|jgi:type I restriction enzyme S subunit